MLAKMKDYLLSEIVMTVMKKTLMGRKLIQAIFNIQVHRNKTWSVSLVEVMVSIKSWWVVCDHLEISMPFPTLLVKSQKGRLTKVFLQQGKISCTHWSKIVHVYKALIRGFMILIHTISCNNPIQWKTRGMETFWHFQSILKCAWQ